jgi:hypothetical protein
MHKVMLATFRRFHIPLQRGASSCGRDLNRPPGALSAKTRNDKNGTRRPHSSRLRRRRAHEIMDPETRSKKASTCVSQVIVESAYCGLSSGGMAANKVTAVHAALELFQAMT